MTRGWADPLNRPRYDEYDSPMAYRQSLRESRPIGSGDRVRVQFPLQANDYRFDEGSHVGLVVYATDREFTLHPPGASTVSLSLAESAVRLPVVGGAAALTDAFADETTTEQDTRPGTRTTDGTERSGDDATATSSAAADGPIPGYAVGGALAGLGAAAARLRRRGTHEARDESE